VQPTASAGTDGDGPRLVQCDAYGPVKIPLEEVLDASGSLDLNPEIEAGDYFAVSLHKGQLTLRAGAYVGFIPLNERVVVHVRPRVPMSNLTRVVNLSGYPPTVLTSMRGYDTIQEWNESLLDVYAEQLIRHVEGLMQSGLLREYQRREEVSSFPRGRVLLHQTVQRQRPRGITHAAHVSWFERSADVAPNRCIKYAIWLLAQRYIAADSLDRRSRQLHRLLNGLYARFDDVELDHRRAFLEDPVVIGARPLPTLRAYYRDALNVAVAVIQQRAVLIESPGREVRLPSIVMNMNYVFEAYVRNILQLHAETNSWSDEVLDGNESPGRKLLFNEKPSEYATPDIVLRAPDRTTPLVVEVKNVPVKDVLSDRSHINQAVTYGVSYRTKRVVLVHPRRSVWQPAGLRLQGVVDEIEIYQYCYDLNADDLEAEEDRFGLAIGGLRQ
jgi:5-methylcytosine-specific restriction enzyme subunit McrC